MHVSYLYYQHIIEQFRDARSIFRLSKSIFEVKRIQLIRERTTDPFARVINSLSRLFYLFFWLFDNLQILLKLVNPNNLTIRHLVQTLSRRFQLAGQLLFLIYCVKTLRRTYTDESDMKVAALNKMTVKTF